MRRVYLQNIQKTGPEVKVQMLYLPLQSFLKRNVHGRRNFFCKIEIIKYCLYGITSYSMINDIKLLEISSSCNVLALVSFKRVLVLSEILPCFFLASLVISI